LGVTVTTIVFNRVVAQDSAKMGIIVDAGNTNAPREASLHGYRAAQWTAFAFGVIGQLYFYKALGFHAYAWFFVI
jgi:hypothetical protein